MENNVCEHLNLLGHHVRDRITAFEGVVTTVGFDLFGCIQAVVTPQDKDGKAGESRWLDEKRLEILSEVPVLEQPQFAPFAMKESDRVHVAGGPNTLPDYPSSPLHK